MINIKSINFQRNGVMGEPFYSVVYTRRDYPSRFLATFRLIEGTDNRIDITSCRVVVLEDNSQCWRGDEEARELQDALDARKMHKEDSFYDLISDHTHQKEDHFYYKRPKS
jgi:hypothetical protein